MVEYRFVCTNTSNIALKKIRFDERINENLTISATLTGSTDYDSNSMEYIFIFGSNLDAASWNTMYNLVLLIGEERSLNTVYPELRQIANVNGKIPSFYNDQLNGYSVGDICIDSQGGKSYICYSNIIEGALWYETSSPRTQSIFYNSGGALITNSYIGNGNQYSNVQDSEILIPESGLIRNMYVYLGTGPGSTGDSWSLRLYKNGVSTNLVVTLSGSTTTGSDIIDTVAVTSFDRISILSTKAGTGSNQPSGIVTISYVIQDIPV